MRNDQTFAEHSEVLPVAAQSIGCGWARLYPCKDGSDIVRRMLHL